MRFRWLVPATVMLVVVACSGGGSSSLKPLPVEDVVKGQESDCRALETLQISFSPSTSDSKAEVYAVRAVQVDFEYVTALAQKLGISGKPTQVSMHRLFAGSVEPHAPYEVPAFVAKDSNGELIVEERTGNISYSRGSASTSSDERNAISEDDAGKKAEEFLQNLGLALPGELGRVERVEGKGINLAWFPQGFRTTERWTPLAISISLGNDGVVEGMSYLWQDLQPIGEYPLASQADAVRRLRHCEAIFGSTSPSPPSVDEVRIEYMGVPSGGPFQYFVPVYHFGNDLELLDTPEGGVERLIAGRATDAYVLAIADEYIEASSK